MSADDILYSPITTSAQQATIDQALITQVAIAIGDPKTVVNFMVTNKVSLATYQKVAEIIEADQVIARAALRFVTPDGLGLTRPAGSLTITSLFETLYRDPTRSQFYWACRGGAVGVEMIEFANIFTITSSIPCAGMTDGRFFELWILSLMSKFAGYQGYYVFSDQALARSYWKS